jgi:signal transduction histidine kinase
MKRYIVIIGVLAIIISALVILSVFFQRTLQMETAEQFNRQQLLLANAEASNIQTYLSVIKEEMLHIAQSVSLFQIRKETDYKLMTNVVFKDSDNVKKRIEFLDRNGVIFFSRGNVHAEGPDEKKIISRAQRLCPGDVQIEQDAKMITIVAPVCRYDSLIGAVVLTLDIQDIARTFLSPIKSGSRGYAWMMDEKGNLLYHPTQPNMVGRNLYKTDSSCFKCHKTFDVEKKIIEGRGDYYGKYVAPTGEDKILAFSTTAVGNARWIVAVSAPYSEVTMSTKRSMKLYAWIIILIFMTTSGVAATLLVLSRKQEQAEERAKHEKEIDMMHSEKLASLERLTSGITSEIGNPLTSVFSFIDVLMDMEDDEFKKETLETIFFHMNRISDILKQLSSFSKTPPMELKPCKVNSLIEESLALIRYDERVQDITIVRNFTPDMPAITMDGNQLSQVIVNIVLNAADAMPNGGTLTIRSRVENNSIVIDFEDTGVGIDKENLSRIFDPFYTTKEHGTGLGLAVSYSIIKKLNGSLTVESDLNKGSRFMITLPIKGAQ